MAQPLVMLFTVTDIVLLILCANLANLLLARASARGQETAVRLALGAGRFRLLRQWLTESLLISVIGGAAGIFVAMWVNAALIGFIPADFRSNLDTPFGWRVFGFTLGISVVVGAVVGLAPAIRASRIFHGADSARRIAQLRCGGKLIEPARRAHRVAGCAIASFADWRGIIFAQPGKSSRH